MQFRQVVFWTLLAPLLAASAHAAERSAARSPAAPGPALTPAPTTRTVASTRPVPFLSAEEAIATMNLPPGLKMEVVAEEPMVQHPVAMTFDADGRMWVVEMRSYMPDARGAREDAPTGRVSILEDTDHDGHADRSTIFLDHLVLPRAVAIVRDGALVAAPPNLWFCRDTDGDGHADEQTLVADDYGEGKWNPEHQANGLLHALDNWIYSAAYDKRLYSLSGGRWITEHVPSLGQWGISQDNSGRLYHDSNSDHLRASFIPPHYADRNIHHHAAGANEQLIADQSVWPAHGTAVNRGYLDRFLRGDGTLARFTAACAPLVYRGGLLGPEYEGNAFVCEPSANVIRRCILTDNGDGSISAANAYDQREFIASTYERFRPVNLYTGPDGALYVIDMHHGLLQHRNFLTTYGRAQYLARQLDKYLLTGRIYRILPGSIDPRSLPAPHLSNATSAELVEQLSNQNGWWRDMAQQLLVEREDYRVASKLRKLATTGQSPLGRLHALWTMSAMRLLDPPTAVRMFADADPHVRAAAIRCAEPLLASPRKNEVMPALLKLAGDSQADVRLQFALTVSPLGTPEAEAALVGIAHDASTDLLRDAIISGLRGRELPFLQALLAAPQWQESRDGGRAMMLATLSGCVIIEGNGRRVSQLLELAAEQPVELGWRAVAILDGFPAPPKNPRARRLRPIMVDAEPAGLAALSMSSNEAVQARLTRVRSLVHWPGQPGYIPAPPPRPLSAAEQARFETGRRIYAQICAQCHKPDGMGQEGMAPPLVDSEWALGPDSRLARIVIHGLAGPVTVSGRTFNLEMPALPTLSDEDIASVLTYVRREWGHTADPVSPEDVAQSRAESANKTGAWTERELLRTP